MRNTMFRRLTALAFILAIVQMAGVDLNPPGRNAYALDDQGGLDVPYVPTPENVVEKMLDMADVTDEDLVYDLGCGDGRIVIAAAKERGARGVGIDLNRWRIIESIENARAAQVTDRVRFMQQDLFETDLGDATVVTLYLLPSVNLELRPKLFRELMPGTRIVSHDFDMGDWAPDQVAVVEGSTVYFWVIPANVSGAWEWTMPDQAGSGRCVLKMDQEYQYAAGTLHEGSSKTPLRDVRIAGRTLSFTADQRVNGKVVPMYYEGILDGSSIEGFVKANDGSLSSPMAWKAQRDPSTRTPIDRPADVEM